MRFSRVVAFAAPRAPFPKQGKNFEALFVEPEAPKKAWHGQDKDAFFRDKYAHVHAKQLKRRQEEQSLKRQRQGDAPRAVAAKPTAQRGFAQELASARARRPNVEYIFGTNAVRAAVESRPAVHKLYNGHASLTSLDPALVALCRERRVPIANNVPAQHLNLMAENGVHNKVVLEVDKRAPVVVQKLALAADGRIAVNKDLHIERRAGRVFKHPLGLFVDQVTDTHNLGALIRSAHFFGASFVAISSRNSASLSPAVYKASAGAAEFMPVLEVPRPLRLFDDLKESGWAIVSTAPSRRSLQQHSIELEEVSPAALRNLDAPTLLVVGSEGDGIRTSLLTRSTHQTTLATDQSSVDSLNVSVAAAVLLHAFTS